MISASGVEMVPVWVAITAVVPSTILAVANLIQSIRSSKKAVIADAKAEVAHVKADASHEQTTMLTAAMETVKYNTNGTLAQINATLGELQGAVVALETAIETIEKRLCQLPCQHDPSACPVPEISKAL